MTLGAPPLPNPYRGIPPLADHPDLDAICARFPATDLGMGERFLARHGSRFRFVEGQGWQCSDGAQWQGCGRSVQSLPPSLVEAMKDTIRAVQREQRELGADCLSPEIYEDSRYLSKWGFRCERFRYLRTLASIIQPALSCATGHAQAEGY